MPETLPQKKGFDLIAAEAAQHAEESAGELRRRLSVADLAAIHARKCADEARGALQSDNHALAAQFAREAIQSAQQAADAARVML